MANREREAKERGSANKPALGASSSSTTSSAATTPKNVSHGSPLTTASDPSPSSAGGGGLTSQQQQLQPPPLPLFNVYQPANDLLGAFLEGRGAEVAALARALELMLLPFEEGGGVQVEHYLGMGIGAVGGSPRPPALGVPAVPLRFTPFLLPLPPNNSTNGGPSANDNPLLPLTLQQQRAPVHMPLPPLSPRRPLSDTER